MRLKLDPAAFTPGSGEDLQRQPFTSHVVLTDGGVYDNLGLETVVKRYRTILVSDGGQKILPSGNISSNWYSQMRRVLDVVDNQVRSLRKRSVLDAFAKSWDGGVVTESPGTYWGIRTNISDYGLADSLACTAEQTAVLAATPTRLARLDHVLQERLINWGYGVCDAAMRRHVDPSLAGPASLPYPDAGFG
jgi:NTE family protein